MNCPKCHADLTGDPIPADIRDDYESTHWGQQIGLTNGDSIYPYQCPDCGHEWLVGEQYRQRAADAGWILPELRPR